MNAKTLKKCMFIQDAGLHRINGNKDVS